MRDGVAFEESGLRLDLIPGLADLDRLRSSGDGFVVEAPLIWSVALAGLRYLLDRRGRHHQQFRAHGRALTVDDEGQLAVAFQPVELGPHRRGELLPAPARPSSPDPLQHHSS